LKAVIVREAPTGYSGRWSAQPDSTGTHHRRVPCDRSAGPLHCDRCRSRSPTGHGRHLTQDHLAAVLVAICFRPRSYGELRSSAETLNGKEILMSTCIDESRVGWLAVWGPGSSAPHVSRDDDGVARRLHCRRSRRFGEAESSANAGGEEHGRGHWFNPGIAHPEPPRIWGVQSFLDRRRAALGPPERWLRLIGPVRVWPGMGQQNFSASLKGVPGAAALEPPGVAPVVLRRLATPARNTRRWPSRSVSGDGRRRGRVAAFALQVRLRLPRIGSGFSDAMLLSIPRNRDPVRMDGPRGIPWLETTDGSSR
jgi:hypothetical protein